MRWGFFLYSFEIVLAVRLVLLSLLASLGAELGAEFGQQAVPAERHASTVAIISVRGPIDDVTVVSVMRRAQRAVAGGAGAIVLEFDTPGGDLLATLQLCNYIKTQMPANTVAWIHPHAYSAGTILALATREILVAPGSAFGDAAPIQVMPGAGLIPLPATERAKMEAPIISEVVDSARRRGYDENLVQGFVRLGSELWLIENIETHKRALVDAVEYSDAFGENPPRQSPAIHPNALATGDDGSEAPDPWFARFAPIEVLESPSTAPRPRVRLAAADRGEWKPIGQIVKSDQLLVLHPEEAIALGIAKGPIANDQELAAWFGATSLTRLDENWSEWFVRFLTSWPVRIALIVALLVGFVVESITPGFGLFGVSAAVALLLLVGAPAFVGLAEWWELLAVVVGLALVALDVVILPLGGWVALCGGALVLGGLVSSFVTRDLSSVAGQQQLFMSIGSTLAGIFGSVTILWFASKSLPHSPFARRAILTTVASSQRSGAITSAIALPAVGTIATALTTLRPSGRVLVDNRPIDAQTSGEFVEPGMRVRIVRHRGTSVEVEPIGDDSGAALTNRGESA